MNHLFLWIFNLLQKLLSLCYIYIVLCCINEQIPYQTNKSSLVEKIAELVESKVITNNASTSFFP